MSYGYCTYWHVHPSTFQPNTETIVSLCFHLKGNTPKFIKAINYLKVAEQYLGQNPSLRDYKEHFGSLPSVATATWEWLVVTETVPQKAKPHHLLWLFLWFCTGVLEGPCSRFLKVDQKTFRKWRDLMEIAVSNLPVVRGFAFDI